MAQKVEKSKSFRVVSGNVSLTIFPLSDGRWRFGWRDDDGRRRWTTAFGESAIIGKAKERADLLALGDVTPLKASELKEFRAWSEARKTGRGKVADLVARFVEETAARAGRSAHYSRNLRQDLAGFSALFGSMAVGDLQAEHVKRWISRPVGPRRRANLHSAVSAFLGWCRRSGELPEGMTAAERVPRPRVERKTPETLTPAQLSLVLRECSQEHVAWVALVAFGGLRSEECRPDPRSGKKGIEWRDIDFARGVLLVRPEVAKTGRKRLAHLPDVLRVWLEPIRGSGPVCPGRRADYNPDGQVSETRWLGAVLGGTWPRNCLRHSFISYRAAQAGLGRAAMEAGNSEGEAARSYNDAQRPECAAEWFGLTPAKVGRVWPSKAVPDRSRKAFDALKSLTETDPNGAPACVTLGYISEA